MRPVWFAAVALFTLLSMSTRVAHGASLTCMQASMMTDALWNDFSVKRLRDQGLTRPQQPICSIAMLSGRLEGGDANGLESMTQANLPFLYQLVLDSNGGDVAEAMEIGRVVRHYYVETQAPTILPVQQPSVYINGQRINIPGAMCASACFFVWLGGVNRSGELLGIHRPFPPISEVKKLSPGQAQQLYHDLSDKILAYLSEMDAASHWLNDMMKTPSDEIHTITEAQFDELQGDIRTLGDVPSFAQWKAAKCGELSAQEFGDWVSISAKRPIPESLRGYLNYLERKHREIVECGYQTVTMARWQLRTAGSRN